MSDQPCDGRRNEIGIHCYTCHHTVSMLRCSEPGRAHQGHAAADERRGWAEHAKTCVPNLLAPDGRIPLTAHPCGCITRRPECAHHTRAAS